MLLNERDIICLDLGDRLSNDGFLVRHWTEEKFNVARKEVICEIESFLKTRIWDNYTKDEKIQRAFMDIWHFACERLKKMQYPQDVEEYHNICYELHGIIPHC